MEFSTSYQHQEYLKIQFEVSCTIYHSSSNLQKENTKLPPHNIDLKGAFTADDRHITTALTLSQMCITSSFSPLTYDMLISHSSK